MEQLRIFRLLDADNNYIAPINNLLAQLSSSPHDFTIELLKSIVESESSFLFIATVNNEVCGMITLGSYITPTGRKLWIEDVVVDSKMRGKSIGRKMVEHVIEYAKQIGGTLMLTSRSSRVAANALYRSVGFEYKSTNVYKMKL